VFNVLIKLLPVFLSTKENYLKVEGKAISVQARTGPEGTSRFRLPDFTIIDT
jgi:hypothetical protein